MKAHIYIRLITGNNQPKRRKMSSVPLSKQHYPFVNLLHQTTTFDLKTSQNENQRGRKIHKKITG